MRRLRIADRLRFSFDPLLRRTYSEARALIVVAPYVRDLLSCLSLPRLHFMSEAGVVRPHGQRSDRTQAGSPRRLLFVGRVVRTKGARDAIHALAHLRDAQATLDIVGTGEDLPACQRAVHELRLEDRVRFHGHIARSDVTALYRQADVFVFPSFREPSGKAVIEAMSHGLPVIATNYGGPGFVVDDQCGRLVEPAPPDEFAMAIAARIDSLLEDPALQTTLGAGALRRIEERYTWDKKVDWLCELYQELI